LFKLFGYLDSSKELNVHGIGLGLYICKKMVEEFCGEISVKSVLGQGSEFSFTFKLSEMQIDQRELVRIINPRPWVGQELVVP
jgi:two-component system sensor histidine kinase EvgS